MDPSESDQHPTAPELLAFHQQACLPQDRHRIEQHLSDCPRCRTELAALETFDFDALESPPPRSQPLLHPEAGPGTRGWRRWMWRAIGLALGVGALAMLCARGLG